MKNGTQHKLGKTTKKLEGGGGGSQVRLSGVFCTSGTEPAVMTSRCCNGSDNNRGDGGEKVKCDEVNIGDWT